MTAKQANQIAAGIVARIPTVNGEWVETEKARAVVRRLLWTAVRKREARA